MRAERPGFLRVFPIVVAMYVPLCMPNERPTLWPSEGQQIAGDDRLEP